MFGFDDSAVKKSIGSIFAVLLVFGFVPILGLVRLIPLFKEVVLGAAVVVAFTTVTETKRAVKFALVTGMIAVVLFNVVYVPGQFLLGGLVGTMGGGMGEDAAGMAVLSGLGALTHLIGLVLFSPVGYAIGGAIGGVLNS